MKQWRGAAIAALFLATAFAPTAQAATPKATGAPIVWFEIPVTDAARAQRFYGTVFGWTFTPFPAYGHDAWRIRTGTPGLEGVFTPQLYTVKTNGPILFVRVADVETALTRALALGGSIERTRTPVSASFGSTVVIRDPDKNAIGLVASFARSR